ncbi:hypothetical protein ACLXAZ_32800, partial [Escherichia coli]
ALTTSGKVRGDGDMCFYGQTSILGGAVQLTANWDFKAIGQSTNGRTADDLVNLAIQAVRA